MELAELRSKLEDVNDWLVDAENSITPDGDVPAFTLMHTALNNMLDLVVGLINDQDDE